LEPDETAAIFTAVKGIATLSTTPISPHEEIVDLVDDENRIVGRAKRSDVRAKNLLHRGVGIVCKSSAGQVYVHRRTTTKDVFPGLYDMLVGGVVGSGESYEAAARREILEELGIDGPEPRHLFHHLYLGPLNRSWVAVYEVIWDGPIRHQESEVAWGSYLSLEEVIAKLEVWEWVPDGLEIFQRYRELLAR
jgi:8-oxo-dGTP pyrophosphatase MutT (NUDIX family)